MHTLEVVLLGILIAIFLLLLVLTVIIVYLVVKILRNLSNASQKVSDAADNIPEALRGLGKRLVPLALPAFATAILKRLRKSHKEEE